MSTLRLPAKGIVSFQRTTRATRAAPAFGRVASARATRLMTRCQVLCAQTVRAVVPLLELHSFEGRAHSMRFIRYHADGVGAVIDVDMCRTSDVSSAVGRAL